MSQETEKSAADSEQGSTPASFNDQQSQNAAANQLARKADWALEDEEFQEAIELFTQALELDPEYGYAQFGLAQAYIEHEEAEHALPLLQQLIAQYPEELELQNELGLALSDLERNEEAIEAFTTLIEKDPHYPAPYANLGALLEASEQYDKAIKAFENYLEWSDDPEESEEIEDRLEALQRRIRRQERHAKIAN